jgi:PIN domain nuclease of toxin-antitoxin system
MKLLLDTHSLLWFLDGDAALSPIAREVIEDTENELFLSVASLWELAIKISVGKLALGRPFGELIPEQLAAMGIVVVDVSLQHLTRVIELPWHHRDPFDRLIVAQALVDDLPVVGRDAALDAYGIQRIW